MIALESKTATTSTTSPLQLSVSEEGIEEGGGLSFSELLRGVKDTKDTKGADALLLALEDDKELVENKKDGLLSLLKLDTKESLETLALNPALSKELTPKELKVVIAEAKEYLKNKITQQMHLSKEESTKLPKTLKGLASLASKIGIDISKITLEEFQGDTPKIKKTELKIASQDENSLVDDGDQEGLKRLKATQKSQSQSEVELRSRESRFSLKTTEESKMTPLFKSQGSREITTEQLVSTKQNLHTSKEIRPKSRADETLKMLLQGKKSSNFKESGLGEDFSVATARVIAPKATKLESSLESLLKGKESSESSTMQKLDGVALNAKTDGFEIKLNEAKQMTKYLSADVKNAIEDYKSPFTRVKVDLNPQRLGSVELTVVQRGKNLHINLSSNNAAINALAMNASDLRVQLQNSGINNASLNFNNSDQTSQQSFSGGGGNHSHQEREASKEYGFFENEEKNEEMMHSLEIVVPYYA